MIPIPTPAQAVHVLEILERWTKRGWRYEVDPKFFPAPGEAFVVWVHYTDPDNFWDWNLALRARGVNHFDALCQATTVMQVLLEEHPENT